MDRRNLELTLFGIPLAQIRSRLAPSARLSGSSRRNANGGVLVGASILLLGLIACTATGVAPKPDSPQCQRVSLDPAPAWGYGPVWGPQGRELVLMDIAGGRLLRYSREGDYLGAVTRPGLGPLEFTHPTRLLSTSDGYLLSNDSSHFIWFDREFRPLRSLDFRRGVPGIASLQVSDAALLGGGKEMLALANTQRNGTWWQGFVRLNLEPLEIVEFIREIPEDSTGDLMYRLSLPSMAVAGGSVYALWYSQVPSLVRLTAPQASLAAFPAEFATLPDLADARSAAAAAPALFSALEAASYPVALYGRGEYLYVLTRRPRADRGTWWQITQVDPKRDVVMRTVTLPTDANHLDLAPGPERWALVEKGPVLRQGVQQFGAVVLMDSTLIEDPAAPDRTDAYVDDCR